MDQGVLEWDLEVLVLGLVVLGVLVLLGLGLGEILVLGGWIQEVLLQVISVARHLLISQGGQGVDQEVLVWMDRQDLDTEVVFLIREEGEGLVQDRLGRGVKVKDLGVQDQGDGHHALEVHLGGPQVDLLVVLLDLVDLWEGLMDQVDPHVALIQEWEGHLDQEGFPQDHLVDLTDHHHQWDNRGGKDRQIISKIV